MRVKNLEGEKEALEGQVGITRRLIMLLTQPPPSARPNPQTLNPRANVTILTSGRAPAAEVAELTRQNEQLRGRPPSPIPKQGLADAKSLDKKLNAPAGK
jgi:hypothetical protein